MRRTSLSLLLLLSTSLSFSFSPLASPRALPRQVSFHNLGLLIVDEEQRFGVRQKDKVKAASTSVDVLSLSATPIPRTMYMCMAGIRKMSTLNTPPQGRLPVQTLVRERDNGVAEAAVREELARGGQGGALEVEHRRLWLTHRRSPPEPLAWPLSALHFCPPLLFCLSGGLLRPSLVSIAGDPSPLRPPPVFYVVPRIEMVEQEVDFLTSVLPDARIAFAYSGIPNLEEIIVKFTLGEIDVLVATTIMENGIDIPNVNTIVVQNTQLFGLAQLHQLRGRVGRARVQAYAYMMHPPLAQLSAEAKQRLRVLQRETDLGAGHALAQSDLQMRGAGNLFGEAQKGETGMSEIGVDLYVEVLQKAMRYLERKQAMGLPDDDEIDAELLQASIDETLLMGIDDALAAK